MAPEKQKKEDNVNTDTTSEGDSSTSDTQTPGYDNLPMPLDGGYGWVIVFASFVIQALQDGICNSYGIFLEHIVAEYGGGRGKTALAGSLLVGVFLMIGPLAGILVNIFGCRPVAMAGGLIGACAFALSTLAPGLDVFILIFGAIGGIGLGFAMIPSFLCVSFYFQKKRSLATGIMSAGGGFGMVVLSFVFAESLNTLGWKSSMFIAAGLYAQVIVLGALLRPLELNKNADTVSKSDSSAGSSVQNANDTTPMIRSESQNHGDVHLENTIFPNKSLFRTLMERKEGDFLSPIPDESPKSDKDTLQKDSDIVKLTQSLPDVSVRNSKKQKWTNSQCDQDIGHHKEKFQTTKSSKSHFDGLNHPFVRKKEASRARNENIRHIDRSLTHHRAQKHHITPLSRKDIFYSGSVMSLKQYKAQPNELAYIKSVTTLVSEDEPYDDLNEQTMKCIPGVFKQTCSQVFDLSILKNLPFLLILLASVMIQLGYFIPIYYIVAVSSKIGVEKTQTALLVSLIGISNTVGRAGAGWLANLRHVRPLHVNNISLILVGAITIFVPFINSYGLLVAYAVAFGLLIGAFVPISVIFLVEYLGLEKLTSAFSVLSLIRGASSMAGPPTAGAIYDATGSYEVSFYLAGGLFISAGLLHYLLPAADRITNSNMSTSVKELNLENGLPIIEEDKTPLN
ncbi:unnamed protein product [Owenia fusiformis]|uniref:Uncharacterized protein n=1 Tax=Owenia fusiformis TaxID=6347 RepID=A0A8J1TY10_OWEFU|nr:unnamed protein product [Owenia fusiformis]